MNRREQKKIKQKMAKIAIERFNFEGIARILINCIRDDSNLRPFDSETLATILLERIIAIKKDINYIHKIMKI